MRKIIALILIAIIFTMLLNQPDADVGAQQRSTPTYTPAHATAQPKLPTPTATWISPLPSPTPTWISPLPSPTPKRATPTPTPTRPTHRRLLP